jgi:hypothetical protein
MAEDIYVFEDQGRYGLVALVGGYLLVYFLLDYDITSGSSEGYSGGCLSVPDGIFLTENCTRYTHHDQKVLDQQGHLWTVARRAVSPLQSYQDNTHQQTNGYYIDIRKCCLL